MSQRPQSQDWPTRFQPYLNILAEIHLNRRLRSKLGASDIVQQTLLQAHRAIDTFQGTTDAEMAVWLRQILARNLAHAVRDFAREKRDVGREVELDADLEQTSRRLDRIIASEQTSPSLRAVRNERWLQLVKAMDQLPESQRDAVALYYLETSAISEISARLGKTPAAVSGLLKRGLRKLRELME